MLACDIFSDTVSTATFPYSQWQSAVGLPTQTATLLVMQVIWN